MIRINIYNQYNKSYLYSDDNFFFCSQESGFITSPINDNIISTCNGTNQNFFFEENENNNESEINSFENFINLNTFQETFHENENNSESLFDEFDKEKNKNNEQKEIVNNLEDNQEKDNIYITQETQINAIFEIEKYKKHSKFRKDNAYKRFIIKAIKSTTKYFLEEIKLFKREYKKIKKESIKLDWNLYEPTITSELKKIHINELNKFLGNKISYFFEKLSKPKFYLENNKDKNKRIIKEILEYEKKISKNKMQILFNTPFKTFLKAFLKNKTTISVEGTEIILNKKFKTLENCLEDYPEKKKKRIKEYIEKIIKNNKNIKKEKAAD